jgi:hypothetical protein
VQRHLTDSAPSRQIKPFAPIVDLELLNFIRNKSLSLQTPKQLSLDYGLNVNVVKDLCIKTFCARVKIAQSST